VFLECPFLIGEIDLVGRRFGCVNGRLCCVNGKFGFFGSNIEIVVPKPPKDTFAANAKEPYLAASETFPRVVAEQRKDPLPEKSGTGQATHVRVTADAANTRRLLRNRS